MKAQLIALSFLATSAALFGQAEVEFFSEMGETFTVYLNQQPQNEAPASRISVSDIDAGFYHLRVDFEDPSLADFAKNNLGIEAGKRSVYMVKMTRKGDYTARFHSFVELQGQDASAQSSAPPASSSPTIHTSSARASSSDGTAGGQVNTETVSMKVSMGNALGAMGNALGEAANNLTMDVTITETSSSSSSSSWGDSQGTASVSGSNPGLATQQTQAMSSLDFEDYLRAIAQKTFEDAKLSTAQAPLRSQSLTAAQIAQVMRAFTFEDSRIAFAIFAHDRCVDPGNYYKTYDALEFELSIEEIEEAIGQ